MASGCDFGANLHPFWVPEFASILGPRTHQNRVLVWGILERLNAFLGRLASVWGCLGASRGVWHRSILILPGFGWEGVKDAVGHGSGLGSPKPRFLKESTKAKPRAKQKPRPRTKYRGAWTRSLSHAVAQSAVADSVKG